MLPRDGVVYGDPPVAMAWLYIDTTAKVGFPHWLITSPGLSLAETRDAVSGILDAFDDVARRLGVHTLVAVVHEEGIAREAINQFGFQYIGQGATLWKPVNLWDS